jgi:3-phenylpropionate/cinnamic acid dioxygenase small subunit
MDTKNKVEQLLHDYADCIDEERYEDWPELFLPSASYRIVTREQLRDKLRIGVMECRNRAMMRDRIYSMRNANIFAPHHYRHLLGSIRVVSEADGVAKVRSGFALVRIMGDGRTDLFLSGAYVDEIDLQGEQPRFAQRTVVLDSSRVDTLIVIPV